MAPKETFRAGVKDLPVLFDDLQQRVLDRLAAHVAGDLHPTTSFDENLFSWSSPMACPVLGGTKRGGGVTGTSLPARTPPAQ